ncbi:MAG: cupin domain-containing protein [Deltaproteobacteria bacterium]|nr:cupin domain-containing protein [Deltaproteobacteria bacterium]
MIKRNVEDEEVKRTFYQAHGGALARMILTAPDLRGLDFLAHAILAPGKKIEAHVDPYEEIYFVLEGQGLIQVGDEEAQVGPLDATYLPAGRPHALTNTGQTDLVILVVAAPPIRDLM